MNDSALYTFSFILAVFTMIELVKLFSNSTHNSHIAEEATKIRLAKQETSGLVDRFNKVVSDHEEHIKNVHIEYESELEEKDKTIKNLDGHIRFMEKILTGRDLLEDYKYYEVNDYGHIRFFKED